MNIHVSKTALKIAALFLFLQAIALLALSSSLFAVGPCDDPLSDRSFAPAPPSSKSSLSQTSAVLPQLYEQASFVKPTFFNFIERLGSETGSEVVLAKLKAENRVHSKVIGLEGKSFAKVFDLVRAALLCETLEDVYRVHDAVIRAAEGTSIEFIRVVDRFAKPRETGYRDLLLHFRVHYSDAQGAAQSHIVELQIHMKDLFLIKKKEADFLYREIRVLEEARDSGEYGLNQLELEKLERLKRKHRELFDKGFKDAVSKYSGKLKSAG